MLSVCSCNYFFDLLVYDLIKKKKAAKIQISHRCEIRQQSHRSCHEDIWQLLSGYGAKISDCAAEQVTSYEKCVAQHKRATVG